MANDPDIVERLRTKHIYGAFEIEQQRQEAADEIVRLRAALTPDAQTRQALARTHTNPGMSGKPGEKVDYSPDIPEGK